MYICIYIHIYIFSLSHVISCLHLCIYACNTYTYIHSFKRMYTHIYIFSFADTELKPNAALRDKEHINLTHMHTHIFIHTHIHTFSASPTPNSSPMLRFGTRNTSFLWTLSSKCQRWALWVWPRARIM